MPYTDEGKNLMLNALGVANIYVGLLDEIDTEISGGSPAYARKSISYETASGGEIVADVQPVFDIPAGTTVSKVIFMSALTGGIKYGEDDVDNEVFTNQGTYTLTATTLNLNLVA